MKMAFVLRIFILSTLAILQLCNSASVSKEKIDDHTDVCTLEDILKMKLSVSDIKSKTSSLESDICRLKSDFMQHLLHRKNKSRCESKAAFHVAQSSSIIAEVHGAIFILDTLVTNVGRAYNQETGQFTAPCDGTYEFAFKIAAAEGKRAAAQIKVVGRTMGTAWSDCREGWHTAMNKVVVSLFAGDKVWIETRKHSSLQNEFYGNFYTSFSGFYLF